MTEGRMLVSPGLDHRNHQVVLRLIVWYCWYYLDELWVRLKHTVC